MPERDYVAAADASAEAATRNVLEAQREIAVLEKEFEDGKRNLSLYVEAETEHLRHLDAAKRKKAEALYHLESARIGRPPPTPGPQAIPRSPGPEMGAQPSGPIRKEDTVTFTHPIMTDEKGRPLPESGQVVTSRIAPGFPVTAPADAATGPELPMATWMGESHPDFSPADVIDAKGNRTVLHVRENGVLRKDGRIRVFDQTGRLLHEEKIGEPNGNGVTTLPAQNGVG